MTTPLVQLAHDATGLLHSFIYFAPETGEHLVGAGLEAGQMCYFAGRAAPMGPVGGGVVAATFYNFNPALVYRFIPRAWELARPAAIVDARLAAVDAASRRLYGADLIASADMTRMAELARRACDGCSGEGRPLYAGHADLDWPDQPHLVVWHALSLLREHRGDGHIVALVTAGLSGIEAQITHVATGEGFVAEVGRGSRGWTQEDWDDATARLIGRGLLTGQGELSPTGRALRAHIEDETNRLATPPWDHLGADGTAEVIKTGGMMTAAIRAAGAFPRQGVFGPGWQQPK
jgi:hypothetical protein